MSEQASPGVVDSPRKLAARVSNNLVRDVLAKTIASLPDEGHYGTICHGQTGPFRYTASCPGCRRAVLEALRDHEILYV